MSAILDLLEMTADDLREALEPGDVGRNPRSRPLAPGSPGFGDHSAPTVPPADETPRERRDRERRRGLAREVLLGRSSSGTTGDVDLPDAGVGEEWDGLREQARWLIRREVEAGVLPLREGLAADAALDGPSGLRERLIEGSEPVAERSAAPAGRGRSMAQLTAAESKLVSEHQARAVAEGRVRRHWPPGKTWDALSYEDQIATGLHLDSVPGLREYGADRTGAMREFLMESGDLDPLGRPA